MKKTLSFSVIMPVWNVESYLNDAVLSVLAQSFTNWELLLLNDGSSDSSGYICDKWSRRDARIKAFHYNNHGLSVTRNKGIDNAQGDWILFLDSDDLLGPKALEKLNTVINEYQNLDLIAFTAFSFDDGEIVDSNKFILQVDPFYCRSYLASGLIDPLDYYISMKERVNFVANACHMSIRKGFLLDHSLRFLPKIIHEDELFTRELLIKVRNMYFFDEILNFKRNRPGSITHSDISRNNVTSFIKIANHLNRLYKCSFLHFLQEDALRFFQKAVKLTETHFPKDTKLVLNLLFSPLFTSYPWKRRILRLLIGIRFKSA